MSGGGLMLVLVLASSLIPGLAIFALPEHRHGWRTTLNLAGALAKLVLMVTIVWGVLHERLYEIRFPLLPDLDLVLHADALSVFFASLSTVLWLVTTVYAVGYLEGSPHRSRFFGFFSLCVTATVGIALAGNLITFILFYELLTLTTYPLVVHRGTDEALRAGRVYLAYTLVGGTALLAGAVWLHHIAGPVDFVTAGALGEGTALDPRALVAIYWLLIGGLGVKAALVPLHGWLPQAMVAPAPVSALLHAVAVVKAGAFGIVRVTYDVFGIGLAEELRVLPLLAALAAVTIIYGSLRALRQTDLKRRLAYSTVSQISYIALGTALLGPMATTGGIVHLVHQGLMKITLFFCAGNMADTYGIHRVEGMRGLGRRMPWTMGAFTVAALGMIGVPPVAGFVSKWHLAAGGVWAGAEWVVAVLAASSALNAAYFLPLLRAGWFVAPAPDQPRGEARWTLLGPALFTAAAALLVGLLATVPLSPLAWARLITFREYG